ncbi:MAG: MBL fold metallo-hydrolase [Lachnospiraceae bacterium]|nr:MBL fold metallo-hydrolase [Lachnospiraceae bacterium]
MAGLKIGRMILGMCQTNCYFVYKEGSKDVILFDPADAGEHLYKTLTEKGFRVAGILLTHSHFDHIWGSNQLRQLSGTQIRAYQEEKQVCEDAEKNVSAQVGRPYTVIPDVYLEDGAEITIADMSCRLMATPGHTVGSCCYYFKEAGILISGDTLFQGSVGRTDLPTGSMGTLVRSIKDKLFILPDEVKVYPGHGDATTIGEEKQYNPFV